MELDHTTSPSETSPCSCRPGNIQQQVEVSSEASCRDYPALCSLGGVNIFSTGKIGLRNSWFWQVCCTLQPLHVGSSCWKLSTAETTVDLV